MSHKHDELDEFGSGEDEDDKIWNPVIRQALIAGYIKKDVENYGLLKITAAGKRFMKHPTSFMIVEDKEFKDEDEEDSHDGAAGALDPELYSILKDLRKKMAKKLQIPPYVIFQDVSLEQMATMYPVSLQELQNIQGGCRKSKALRSGILRHHQEALQRQRDRKIEELRVRTVAKKSMLKVKIIQSIDRQVALDDIANAQGLESSRSCLTR